MTVGAEDSNKMGNEDGIRQVLLVLFPFLRNSNLKKGKSKGN